MTSPPSRSCFRRTLMTPAIASEPYCADAPSRSTSIDCTIAAGIVFKSTAAAPRPIVPFTFTSDDAWRRFEFTSTSVWSGDKPAQRGRADRVGAVGEAGPREVERRQRDRQRLVDLGDADVRERFAADDVDGHRGFERRAIGDARAGDDDLLDLDDSSARLASCATAATMGPIAPATIAALNSVGRIVFRCTVNSLEANGGE